MIMEFKLVNTKTLKFQWIECKKVLKKVIKYGKIEISIKNAKKPQVLAYLWFYIYQV